MSCNVELTVGDLRKFWENVNFNDKPGCWIWKGHTTSDKGCGRVQPQIWLDGQKISARRLSYLIHLNELPKSVGTSCGNSLCVCPRHLTPMKELKETTGKKFYTRPRSQWVDEKKVRQIVTMRQLGCTQTTISKKVKVSQNTVCTIIKMAKFCKQNKLKPFRKKVAK